MILPWLIIAMTSVTPILSQFFNPLNDKVYMNNIEQKVKKEVENTQADLLREVKVMGNLTENFIAAKLTQNTYKLLRHLSSQKSNKLPQSVDRRRFSSKFPKQDQDDDEGATDFVGEASPLDFAVKLNAIVLKNLLLIPHFLRDTVRKIFPGVGQGALQLNDTETTTLAISSTEKEQEAEVEKDLDIKAEPLQLIDLPTSDLVMVNDLQKPTKVNQISSRRQQLRDSKNSAILTHMEDDPKNIEEDEGQEVNDLDNLLDAMRPLIFDLERTV